MDLQQYVMWGFLVIGFVNITQFALDGNWKSFIKALTGILVGSIAGYFKMFGIPSLEIGILLGISASGLFKIATKLGGTIQPTQPNV